MLSERRFSKAYRKMRKFKFSSMKRAALRGCLIIFIAQSALAQTSESAVEKLSPMLLHRLETAKENERMKVIVEMKRKSARFYRPEELLSPRAIERRMKMVRSGALPSVITNDDQPFDEADLQELARSGLRVRYALKWLNAVSGEIQTKELPALMACDAVRKIDELPLRKKISARKFDEVALETPVEIPASELRRARNEKSGAIEINSEKNLTNAIDYGQSLAQLALSNIPEVHRLGITGRGVLIANFDAGFSNLAHEAFRALRVVARYDFVANRSELGAHSHGTATMGVIAGNQPGRLIGVAYDAEYALARTEDALTETPAEEDNWAAAAQWADSLGADIITSSLGYSIFDPPFPSYRWQDMNGRTAISTRAAARAARLGIVVVNSAGNGGFVAAPANTLGAPADADTVISVGAVNSAGMRAPFSSVGLTADGRIKPDVMAVGVSVFTAGIATTSSYVVANGTSFSCPIVAGVAALLLSANPTLTPAQVRNILRETASQSGAPNREMGWGIVNALAALERARQASSIKLSPKAERTFELYQNYPNPFNPTTVIAYQLPVASEVRLKVFDALGREVATLVSARQDGGRYSVPFSAAAYSLTSGVYFYRLQAGRFSETKKMILVK